MRNLIMAGLIITLSIPAAFAADINNNSQIPPAATQATANANLPDHIAPGTPELFINNVVHQALVTLGNKHLTEAAREEIFRHMLDNDFDMLRISKFVVGRYWNSATDQDRQAFLPLFEAYVVRSYADQFKDFSDERIKVIGSRTIGDLTTVNCQIIFDDRAPINLDWVVRTEPNTNYLTAPFKIIDVSVEGVSLILTQREEFASVISRNGGTLAALNQAIKQKLAQTN